jgi:uncharacterized protein YjiK
MQKLPALALCVALPLLLLSFCHSQKHAPAPAKTAALYPDSLPYSLQAPSLIVNLVNDELREISGLSPTESEGVFLAIADERGEVFFIGGDGGGAVTHRVLFREKGDFEGVEMSGKTIWAVKSDGDLFELNDWEKNTPRISEYKTPLKKTDDVEGLCLDVQRNALLLACKSDPAEFTPRKIYAFDLKTKVLNETPVYVLSPEAVNQFVPYGEAEKHDAFSPSGIALHPITRDVYLISTALKRLVVLDYNSGKIKFAQRLEKTLLPQPEGISFDKTGNLYISSEGKGGAGLLLKFDMKQGANK